MPARRLERVTQAIAPASPGPAAAGIHHSLSATTTMNANTLISFNFYLAVWLSIVGGIAALNFPDFIVPDDDGLYGPLRNNFLIIVGYLLFSQIGLWYFRYLRGSRIDALIMAYTFFIAAAGAKFYAMVNNLPVSDLFVGAMLYFGLSHALYYFAGKADEPESQAVRSKKREPDV
jgi:hypothetical protein